MSSCCSTFGAVAQTQFDDAVARSDLKHYRKRGPAITTRVLRDMLVETHQASGDLLDVGSGIGSLTFELLDRGMAGATAVDASPAYVAAASDEAAQRGRSAAVHFVQDDFLNVAPHLPPAAVVALDRVICCYPLYKPLLDASLQHATQCFAFSYPRDVWYVRWVIRLQNWLRALRRNPFRAFVHPPDEMKRLVEAAGFTLAAARQTWDWAADVYVR